MRLVRFCIDKMNVFLVFFLIVVPSHAQVAGYMGKRFSINYTQDMSPALISPLSNTNIEYIYDLWEPKFAGINLTQGIGFDYIIKPRTSFCLSVHYLKTGLSYYDNFVTGGSGNTGYWEYNDGGKPMQLRVYSLVGGFKFFRQQHFAPFGRYRKLDFSVYLQQVSFKKEGFPPKYYIQQTDYSFATFGVGYTFGKQRIFFDKLVVDWGIRLGVVPFGNLEYFDEEFGEGILGFVALANKYRYVDHSDIRNQLRARADTRVLGAQRVNLHIGIGFLAF